MWAGREAVGTASQCGRCKMGLDADVECGICLGPVRDRVRYTRISNESWDNSLCDHNGNFCRGCLQHHVRSQLSDGCWNIRCPAVSCSYLLVEADIDRVLTRPAETSTDVGELDPEAAPMSLSKDECMMLLAKYKMLRGADHGTHLRAVLRMREEATLAAEIGQDELLQEPTGMIAATEQHLEPGFGTWALESCQACPRCLVIIRKETGCNHIQCRCGASFCYGCGAPSDFTWVHATWGSAANVAPQTCLCRGGAVSLGRWLQSAGVLEVSNATL